MGFFVRILPCILFLSASLTSSLSQAEITQLNIASYADADSSCQVETLDNSPPFNGMETAKKTKTNCAISLLKSDFHSQYEFCALSGIREFNDDRYVREHDFGSHCTFEIRSDHVVFEASRGFGFKDDSTSVLFCGFTCVQTDKVEVQKGEDLGRVISQPLAPWE